MIRLTRLDRREVVLNCDLIECLEASPDTTLRLVTGKHMVVRESVDEVVERIHAWRSAVLARAGATAGALPAPSVLEPLAAALRAESEEELAA
ncbi:MAG TPA: flagellar FlbD family protein [Planctomycetota bacterium]